jgi:hypothetical protein
MKKSRFGLLVIFGVSAAGCSSSSSGSPPSGDDGDAAPAVDASRDAGADAEASEPIMDAAPTPMCDAVSLAVMPDGGNAACFRCQATKCASQLTACATDCACAPAYNCLQGNSAMGLNSGYSSCGNAVDAISNGDPGLTNVAACATQSCNAECFPTTQ